MSKQRVRPKQTDRPRRAVTDTRKVPVERSREVTRTRTRNGEKDIDVTERRMRPRHREVPAIHARVGVSGSGTVNMGDFNSVQAKVWIELPCAPDPVSIQEAYDEASAYVERWVQRELDAATGAEGQDEL